MPLVSKLSRASLPNEVLSICNQNGSILKWYIEETSALRVVLSNSFSESFLVLQNEYQINSLPARYRPAIGRRQRGVEMSTWSCDHVQHMHGSTSAQSAESPWTISWISREMRASFFEARSMSIKTLGTVGIFIFAMILSRSRTKPEYYLTDGTELSLPKGEPS